MKAISIKIILIMTSILLLSACGITRESESNNEPIKLAQIQDTVKVHYTGKLDNGEEFDSSVGREPLSFIVGSGMVIKGFDEAVLGLAVGKTITVRIPPEEAYGSHNPELIFEYPVTEAPNDIKIGDQVMLNNGSRATITDINETSVSIDTNHPLAGKTLTFQIELIEAITPAKELIIE
jgi:peptidylprolyl isomerase